MIAADANLDVQAANAKNFYINKLDGNVGIGTVTPSTLLEVNGDVKFQAMLPYFTSSSNEAAPSYMVPISLLAPSTKVKITLAFHTNNTAGNSAIYYNAGSGDIYLTDTGPCGSLTNFISKTFTIPRPVSPTGTISIIVKNNSIGGCQVQSLIRSTLVVQAVD